MVVFDTSIVLLTIDPGAGVPSDPVTGKPILNCKERVEHLVATLDEARTRILIPTPVLSEFLIKAGKNKAEFANAFLRDGNFLVGSFDQRAAIELAELEDSDLKSGKPLDPATTKAKIKFDRQVIAIAKVYGADTIYTDDAGLAKVARKNAVRPVMTWDLPLPPPKTGDLFRDEEAT